MKAIKSGMPDNSSGIPDLCKLLAVSHPKKLQQNPFFWKRSRGTVNAYIGNMKPASGFENVLYQE
jgi:hypothetical protein